LQLRAIKKPSPVSADEGLVIGTFASLYPPGEIPVMLIMAMVITAGFINLYIIRKHPIIIQQCHIASPFANGKRGVSPKDGINA
jgi:hypothetical protein